MPSTGKGVAHTCASIARELGERHIRVEFFTPYGHERSAGGYRVNNTLPAILRVVPYTRIRHFVRRRNEAIFLRKAHEAASRSQAIAYMWPDPALSVLKNLREAGVPVVREMINCHVGTAKRLLDREYTRLGLAPAHSITETAVATETESLRLSDYVFCPGPLVERSLLDHGVEAGKIVSTSFGWDPQRMIGSDRALSEIDGVTILFVGYLCVRKGVHLLLDAWAKSGVRGRLVLVGNMEPAIRAIAAEHLAREDVVVVKHTPNVGAYYRSADAFVLPSIEEGGPLVTHEAAGCGLPLLVSPMGAARIADGSTGFVIDPHDEAGWIAALQTVASDAELRREFGRTARRKAQSFTWAEVAKPRADAFRRVAQTFAARAAAGGHEPADGGALSLRRAAC